MRLRLLVNLNIFLAITGLLSACGSSRHKSLVWLDCGVGYSFGVAKESDDHGFTAGVAIGVGDDNRDGWGINVGVGVDAALINNEYKAGMGIAGSNIRIDRTLSSMPDFASMVSRWTATTTLGYGGANKKSANKRQSISEKLGMKLFTGPTAALLTSDGMGLSLSGGPTGMMTTEGSRTFGGELRLRLSLGPIIN
ncbi:MAG: hypothetical protein JW841_05320 [Deltaproteobacteria bacterium]|nr:hypothetical protein [Deltaproteobacteria bacterium]